MPSSSGETEAVVVAKRLDSTVVNKTFEYSKLLPGTKVLVTTCLASGEAGGGGAVTMATVARLLAAGCRLRVLIHSGDSAYDAGNGGEGTVEMLEGSVASKADCEKAVEGQDVVVHTVSCSSGVGVGVVEGTRNLLGAAAAAGVKSLVFAGSASVVFGGEDLKASSEDVPYPKRHVDSLSAAIAEAEQEVLRANGDVSAASGNMITCSVRAAAVYGPGERECLVPGLVSRARSGRFACPAFVGNGNNVVDFVYAGNVAHAIVLAAQRLLALSSASSDATAAGSSGRAYFVTDDEPVPFGDFASRVLSGLGYPAQSAGMPRLLAVVLAFFLRVLAVVLSPFLNFRPTLTARHIAEGGRTQCFEISRARKELGYAPLWTQKEGLDITLQALRSLRNPRAKVKHVGPFTLEDVAPHSSEDDAWIIVDGKVYDVTPYLGQHPGGDSMLRNAGGDSTEGFHGPQHPAQAQEILDRHYIGDLI